MKIYSDEISGNFVFICNGMSILNTDLNPIQDELFQGCSWMGEGPKRPPYLKSVTKFCNSSICIREVITTSML